MDDAETTRRKRKGAERTARHRSLFVADENDFKFIIFSTRTYQQMSKECTEFSAALKGCFSEAQLKKLNRQFSDGPSSHLRELARSVVLKYYNGHEATVEKKINEKILKLNTTPGLREVRGKGGSSEGSWYRTKISQLSRSENVTERQTRKNEAVDILAEQTLMLRERKKTVAKKSNIRC